MNFSFRLSLDFHRRFDSENLFNLLMFLPFGFLCPGKRTGSGWLRTAAAGLGLSCAIELLQPFFGRSFDCNDILAQCPGRPDWRSAFGTAGPVACRTEPVGVFVT